MSEESQRQEMGLKQAHHDIHWNFSQHTRIPQPSSDWNPPTATQKLHSSQQLAPKAGVSEPITVQTDPSADNHSFGWAFDSFVQAFKTYLRRLWLLVKSTEITDLVEFVVIYIFPGGIQSVSLDLNSSVSSDIFDTRNCTNTQNEVCYLWSTYFKR